MPVATTQRQNYCVYYMLPANKVYKFVVELKLLLETIDIYFIKLLFVGGLGKSNVAFQNQQMERLAFYIRKLTSAFLDYLFLNFLFLLTLFLVLFIWFVYYKSSSVLIRFPWLYMVAFICRFGCITVLFSEAEKYLQENCASIVSLFLMQCFLELF